MFDQTTARNTLEVALTDARYWADRPRGNSERAELWHRRVLVYELAIETLERVTDRHQRISCPPNADCDHEEPSFGSVLAEIPTTAQNLALLRTTDPEIPLLVAEGLLFVIGTEAQLDRWAEQNA